MKLLVGLGNPGEKYEHTRHNIGFRVIDFLLEKYKHTASIYWHEDKKLKSMLKTILFADQYILLVKPQTFMNLSGEAVQRVMQEYKAKLEDIIVVYDDLDLPVGELRIRKEGGSGGHNGVQSIIDAIGEKFIRVRIGIGRPEDSSKFKVQSSKLVEDYVLEKFNSEEQSLIDQVIPNVVTACEGVVQYGYESYISKHYKKYST